MGIRDNIKIINKKIEGAALKVNRNPDDIKIVAVTKYVSHDVINELYNNGLNTFGESKVQDFLNKYDKLSKDIKWHFIGRLQKNKVKYLVGKIALFHSIDSLGLIEEIDKRFRDAGEIANILLQVNVSRELSKTGFYENDVENVLSCIERYKNITVKGLMTMAPFTDNKIVIKNTFQALSNLYDVISEKDRLNVKMEYLSMGMSGDFEIAISEGSNLVRIGRLLINE